MKHYDVDGCYLGFTYAADGWVHAEDRHAMAHRFAHRAQAVAWLRRCRRWTCSVEAMEEAA